MGRITCIHIVWDVMCMDHGFAPSFATLHEPKYDMRSNDIGTKAFECSALHDDTRYNTEQRVGSRLDMMSGPYSPQWATKTKELIEGGRTRAGHRCAPPVTLPEGRAERERSGDHGCLA